MTLPVWTPDDEENWQRMMEEAARLKRREQLSAVKQQNRGNVPADGAQTFPKGYADGGSFAAPTHSVYGGQRRNGESLFSSAADGSAQPGDRMAATGLGGAGVRLFEYRPTSAFGGASREDAQRFRLYPSADSAALAWQAAPQRSAGQAGQAAPTTSKGQPTAASAARDAEGGAWLFQNPKNYLSIPPAPAAPAPPGVNEQAWQQSVDQYRANKGSDVPVPYPLLGWNFVSDQDRKKLFDLMRHNPKAAEDYAEKVAEQVYKDHPVEKWLPFGPNLPSKREEVKDVDTLEHSDEWPHATEQERTELAYLLAHGKVKEANEYAKKVIQEIRAKRDLDARPAPPALAPEFWDTAKNRDMTGRQIANTVAQEFRDVKPVPGVSTWTDIEKAEEMDAHTILNADRKYGPLRMRYIGTATNEWRPWFEQNEASKEQYQRALDAAHTAFREAMENKADPTEGRFYFNNRYDANTGQRHLGPPKGGEWVSPHSQSPRFQWRENPVYSLVYENPRNMPHTPEEQERIRAQQASRAKKK